MFSLKEKRQIADKIEKLLLNLKHPEMPLKKPYFRIHILGQQAWSWADIEPNWVFDDGKKEATVNPFNEKSRDTHKEGEKSC